MHFRDIYKAMQGNIPIQFLSLIKNIGIINISRNIFYKFSKINKFSKLRRINHEANFSNFFDNLEAFEEDIEFYNDSWEEKQTYFSWHRKSTSNIPEWNKLCFTGELFGDLNKEWLPLELEIEGKYEDRQYKTPDPMIGTERGDTRWRFSAELRLSFTDYASWAVMIKNSDYDSNLPTASYSDLVVGTEIRLSF